MFCSGIFVFLNFAKCFLDIHLIEIKRYFLFFQEKKLRPDSLYSCTKNSMTKETYENAFGIEFIPQHQSMGYYSRN